MVLRAMAIFDFGLLAILWVDLRFVGGGSAAPALSYAVLR